MHDQERTRLTFRYERIRAVASGMLETAGATFLLLIAVKFLDVGPTAKALVAGGGSVGLLFSPLVVSMVESRGWVTTRAAANLAALGAVAFVFMASFANQAVFVLGSVLTMAAASSAIPLMTQVYQDNYPEAQRGRLFSQSVMLRIATAALFSEAAGRFLSLGPTHYRSLLLVYAVAFALASFCLGRIPSRPLVSSGASHPLRSLRYAWSDRLFRQTLICWMLMGMGNLMMLPMRVEYLANPKYNLALSAGEIAFLLGVVPNCARLIMSPVWGVLFDRMNFFVLRITLNVGFALGILAFFTSQDVKGLIVGAIIYGVANAGGDVAWGLWVTKFAPAERVADYMAAHTFFTGVRGVAAPLIAFHLTRTYSVGVVSGVCIGMIMVANLWLFPEIRHGKNMRRGAALVEESPE